MRYRLYAGRMMVGLGFVGFLGLLAGVREGGRFRGLEVGSVVWLWVLDSLPVRLGCGRESSVPIEEASLSAPELSSVS